MARIYPKSKRTIDEYKQIGAELRLFKEIETRVSCDLGRVLNASDMKKLLRTRRLYDEVCSNAENNMYADHPELGGESTSVFYGALSGEPISKTDEEIRILAKKAAGDIFARKNH